MIVVACSADDAVILLDVELVDDRVASTPRPPLLISDIIDTLRMDLHDRRRYASW